MTNTIKNALLFTFLGFSLLTGCGPEFDPASRIEGARVLGARVEVEGAPERATPKPGETANVTWLVAAPDMTPPLGWTFVVCPAGAATGSAGCLDTPAARFDGTATPPRVSIPVPSSAALGDSASVVLYGVICAGAASMPELDRRTGLVACTAGGHGTTVTLDFPLQLGDEANHNPVADRAFTFDGVAWPAPSGDAPCAAQGPRVRAGSKAHVIGETTEGVDRERYTALLGDPPAPAPTRERLQISRFTTAGELKSQFSFVESTDDGATTAVDVGWDAPEAADVPDDGLAVTFTFVVRDERGGADWTTRSLCVTP
ncbi:MAG TPA: hypothetical protein VIU64_07520 [Polyangia bacterium]